MTGKERVLSVLSGKDADKVPWVPFAGVHAGRLLGYSAEDVSTDVSKLVKSQIEVNKMYHPDGQPVMFDLQIEAEILGCDVVWAEDGPPSVSSHPLADNDLIPTYLPQKEDGRLKIELEAVERLKELIGEHTALYGICCGPFTLASHLRGTNIFMDIMLEPEYVHKLLEYAAKVTCTVAEYLVEAGIDVVAVVDPLISQISPAHFEEFMDDPFTRIFSSIRTMGVKSSFFVCGNATFAIENMCKTGCDSISVDENVDVSSVKKITDAYHVTIGGNIPLTSVMLFGNQNDNMMAVVDLIDSVSPHHLIISPGCDMPYDIPPENAIAVEHAIHETDSARNMIKTYTQEDIPFTGTIPDYEHLRRPLVEVFTLDSATCAACTYMLAAARDAAAYLEEPVDVVEYKYTSPQNIARCKVMGVKQLPSIYINGTLCFSSIIPNREELIKSIRTFLDV